MLVQKVTEIGAVPYLGFMVLWLNPTILTSILIGIRSCVIVAIGLRRQHTSRMLKSTTVKNPKFTLWLRRYPPRSFESLTKMDQKGRFFERNSPGGTVESKKIWMFQSMDNVFARFQRTLALITRNSTLGTGNYQQNHMYSHLNQPHLRYNTVFKFETHSHVTTMCECTMVTMHAA